MDVPDFVRLLKQKNMDSEVWWDASPTLYAAFKHTLLMKYPSLSSMIENLLPDGFSDNKTGVSGATTNPRLITQAVLNAPQRWREYLSALPSRFSDEDKARQVYEHMITVGAAALEPRWEASRHRQGWLSAQIEGAVGMSADALVARGLQLASLAPNVMVKVPGSEEGYQAIEELVAQGCSINNTFCFSVSQVAACLKAIHTGQLRARLHGVDTDQAQYVISFMIGRLGAEPEFERQAEQRRLRLTASDRRWAEIAVYQAIQALMRRHPIPARLLLCSLKIDVDACGREHCWHLQRTGADTTLYTLTPHIIEFLIRRQQQKQPITPAGGWVQMPKRVLQRLMAIPYFNQAYFEGDLAPWEFSAHPAFVTASQYAREGQETLLAFVRGGHVRSRPNPWPQSSLERAS
ncbi:transaldolase family protein [Pseudomonas sp. UBA1879]|uniref:transaldolase family protein n=1 Tax=Pseudomonas sp. UBA1879 TaxID=1947305 RepID=UPI0025D74C03|nr:transaldolase family protein [Pseudomonas sp. UBA1879]